VARPAPEKNNYSALAAVATRPTSGSFSRGRDLFADTGAIFLADDLYSKETIIKKILARPKFDYIVTCKEESHITLFSYKKNEITDRMHSEKKSRRERRKVGILLDE
jgi:hypothetical protein